jgi:putative membrane protein insertion efficiency factor
MFRVLDRVAAIPLMALVVIYRVLVSPWLMPACRFTPTCSEYTLACLRHWGLCVGLWHSMRRIGRCHPFHPGGYDPPPAMNIEVTR